MLTCSKEEKPASFWGTVMFIVAGEHLTRSQKTVRALGLGFLFLFMALPILLDWLG